MACLRAPGEVCAARVLEREPELRAGRDALAAACSSARRRDPGLARGRSVLDTDGRSAETVAAELFVVYGNALGRESEECPSAPASSRAAQWFTLSQNNQPLAESRRAGHAPTLPYPAAVDVAPAGGAGRRHRRRVGIGHRRVRRVGRHARPVPGGHVVRDVERPVVAPPRAVGDHDAGAVAGPDEHVLRAARAVEVIPGLVPPAPRPRRSPGSGPTARGSPPGCPRGGTCRPARRAGGRRRGSRPPGSARRPGSSGPSLRSRAVLPLRAARVEDVPTLAARHVAVASWSRSRPRPCR